jgi:hypothetical protein
MVNVVEVAPQSDLLEKVRGLWRAHSDTLGYFPEGAFDERARERCILAAINEDNNLVGYVLFRVTQRRQASIAHLCVDNAARKQGIARHLFEAVKRRVSYCDDILVRCRRDFDASRLWPRLNFVAVDEERGRGKDETVLTIWRYELNQLPLIAAMGFRRDRDVMSVAIDANIFFDLDEEAPGREESRALQANWLGQYVELCLTDEIYNEIDRREDPVDRKRQRARVKRFRVLPSDKQREEKVLAELRVRMPSWTSENDWSDMKQLAKTIAADTTYFVTRDSSVRDQADIIYDRYGLLVVSPFELIVRFDELRHEEEYRPRRFMGLNLNQSKPGEGDLERIVELIHAGQAAPEPKRRTVAKLRDIFANPDRFEVTCISGNDAMLIAAYAIERPSTDVLRLPLLAVAASDLGKTAARHFAEKVVTLAATERRTLVEVEETAGGQRIQEALSAAGFLKEGDLWIKIAIPLVASARDISAQIAQIGEQRPEAREITTRAMASLRTLDTMPVAPPEAWLRVERALWPAKILDTGLPCFIVPIRPHWAEHLFDTELPQGSLYGPNPLLAMSPENAYYRAAKPAILKAPARVLWYVSDPGKNNPGTMSIRACSYIDEVVIDGPKEAFRRFRRLGVYTWRDVFDAAGNALENKLMAFQFSKTELFRKLVVWERLQAVLLQHRGKGHPIISPVAVPEACFLELYKLGMHGA